MRQRNLFKRIICIIVCFLMVICAFSNTDISYADNLDTDILQKEQKAEYDPLSIVRDVREYDEYLDMHKNASKPNTEIRVCGGDAFAYSNGFEISNEFEGKKNVILTKEEGSAAWKITVNEAGLYNVKIVYFPTKGKNNTIEREVSVNGEIPFKNAQYLEFYRVWSDSSKITKDSRDNDVRPQQKETPVWKTSYLKDSDGNYTQAFLFYFEKGENTIEITSVKEPMAIAEIVICQEEKTISYSEYYKQLTGKGVKKADLSEPIKIQAEEASTKSDSTLYAIADRTSPLTEPASAGKLRLNVIGGNNWKDAGQWIAWTVNAPEDGFYRLNIKYRQNIKSGVTVTRTLYIDDVVPFEEARELKFCYENEWCMLTPSDENADPYLFYLTKGEHELKLEVSYGDDLSEILRTAENSVLELNRAYRQLLMVIGSSPDTLRDYQFTKKTPEALKILSEQYEVITDLSQKVDEYARGSKGSDSAVLDNLKNQLEKINKKPESIAKQWSALKDNIVALGSWSLSMKDQPLEIDYILLSSETNKLPKTKPNFLKKMGFEIKKFFASFVEDYDSVGEVYEKGDSVEVWILASGSTVTSTTGSGRDQANIIKNLVDNYFVPEKGIPVNIKLVNSDVLLSATLAGTGPDVALNVAGKEPVNYALRNAVCDISKFDDYEEVTKWFHKEAMEQFKYKDGVYGLPQTMSFHVMFYRADILKEIGAKVPSNWDEFYETLAVIQKNNLNVGINPDYTTYAMYLYQHGGSFYADGGKRSGLDSEEAIAAFQMWTSNYADYRMPVTFDFANRFRSGEMPLSIGDYTNYNYLTVFAPEIRGLWGFTVVPAYYDAAGNENRQVSAWESASIIMETSDKKDKAWEFLKWWMSAEVQSEYGNEMESVLGVAGRVATANLEALASLPWTNADYRQLMEQMQYVQAIPEVAGGYFTERNIKNAFYAVYNSSEDARETLENYVKTINNEITNKRKEFNLDEE